MMLLYHLYMHLDTPPSGIGRQLQVVFLIPVVLVGGVAAVASAGAAAMPADSGVQSTMAQAEQAQPNATATIELSSTPNGLQKYNITVSVAGATDTNISDIKAGDISGPEFQIVNQPADEQSVTFRAADLSENIGRNAGAVTLATLNLTNRSVTENDISLSIHALTDDDGNEISPTQINLTVERRASPNPFPNGVPGVGTAPPTNLDNDPQFEDVNGDGEANFTDAVDLAFANTGAINSGTQAQINALDFDGDGDVDFDDAIELTFDPALS